MRKINFYLIISQYSLLNIMLSHNLLENILQIILLPFILLVSIGRMISGPLIYFGTKRESIIKKYKGVMITGAGSGIGMELAIKYSKDNDVQKIVLVGRNRAVLEKLQEKINRNGLDVIIEQQSVVDKVAMEELAKKYNKIIDLVIASAGVSEDTCGDRTFNGRLQKIYDTNLFGVVNTIQPFIDQWNQNQINGNGVIISSLTAFSKNLSSAIYSSSKNAVMVYGNELEKELRKNNTTASCTVVCPGFVRTNMIRTYKPTIMEGYQAANVIYDEIQKGNKMITFPYSLTQVTKFLDLLPDSIRGMLV